MANAVLIQSPTDFERTLGHLDFITTSLCSPLPEIEPLFRQSLSLIFDDLQYIDTSERGLVTTYLSDIEKPLIFLRSIGFEILAITTTGTMKFANQPEIANYTRTYYLTIPVNGFFRIGNELSGVIHRFNPNCKSAISELTRSIKDSTPVSIWANKDLLKQQLEGNVPWCVECCLNE